MLDLHFQPLTHSDIRELQSWWNEDGELSHRIGGADWPKKLWELIKKDLNRLCWIVRENNKAIGYVEAELHPQENLLWIGIATKPSLKRKGFGKRILQNFLNNPLAVQYKEIWAGIEYDNMASRKCFESVGFKPKKLQPDEEGIIDYVFMR